MATEVEVGVIALERLIRPPTGEIIVAIIVELKTQADLYNMLKVGIWGVVFTGKAGQNVVMAANGG